MYKIGLIGLGPMGNNLARNFASKNFSTLVYNRTYDKTADFINDFRPEFSQDTLEGAKTIEEFIEKLERPRKIVLLIKAGEPTDQVINQIAPLLEKGDIIIDMSNAWYKDTQRRSKDLEEKGLTFIGCGISGGEEGALRGPSLMPGCSDYAWDQTKPLFEAISAKDFSNGPCVTHIGIDGAGHYVKMVHNGIEYSIMQIIAESYEILRKIYGQKPEQIRAIFEKFNNGKLRSFLIEITEKVLAQKDEFQSEQHLIDFILDQAEQKGTGKLTSIDALDRGIAVPSITEAVNARIISSQKRLRENFAPIFSKNVTEITIDDEAIKELENSLHTTMIISYAQGLNLIKTAAQEENWQINISEILRIWQGGCIIRAELLKTLQSAYQGQDNPTHIFEIPTIQNILSTEISDLKTTVQKGLSADLYLPCYTSALNYFQGFTTEKLPANMIQGLRDFFGAHTYHRTDREGIFHTKWS